MMRQVFRLTVCVLGLTVLSSQAFAQALPWEDRAYVNVNYGMQVRSTSLVTGNGTFDLYGESGKLTTAHEIDTQAPVIDVGVGVRVFGNFGVGLTYSRLSTKGSAAVIAEVPSPIYYDQPRTATSTATGLEHVEEGFHFQAVWMLPITERLDVAFSVGPSLFKLSQGVVTEPKFLEAGPPYTAVTMTTSMATVSDSQIGFNVGADLTYRFANNFGVGAMVRYAGATVGLAPEGGTAMDVKVGGFQFGGGLRLRF